MSDALRLLNSGFRDVTELHTGVRQWIVCVVREQQCTAIGGRAPHDVVASVVGAPDDVVATVSAPNDVVAFIGGAPDDVVRVRGAPHDVVAVRSAALGAPHDVVTLINEDAGGAPDDVVVPGVRGGIDVAAAQHVVAPDDVLAPR